MQAFLARRINGAAIHPLEMVLGAHRVLADEETGGVAQKVRRTTLAVPGYARVGFDRNDGFSEPERAGERLEVLWIEDTDFGDLQVRSRRGCEAHSVRDQRRDAAGGQSAEESA